MAQTIPGPLVYESGRSNSDSRAFFAGMPLDLGQINPDYVQFFDDFTVLHGKAFNATDMYDTSLKDTTTVTSADVIGGVCRITAQATTDNSGTLVQMTSTPFARTTGKKLWFEARINIHDVDDCDMFVGLAEQVITDAANTIAAGTHRMGFQLLEGSADLLFAQSNGTTATTVSTGYTAVDATYVVVGFYYNGTTIDVYVNRSLKLSGLTPGPASATDLMGLAFYYETGNATGTHVSDMDYWMVVQER